MKHTLPPTKRFALSTLTLVLSGAAHADPGVMFGVSHNFGGATGVNVKVLSTDRKDKPALALGLSYFPGLATGNWGMDTSLAFTIQRGAATLGYDRLNQRVQFGLGVANTQSLNNKAEPAPAPCGVGGIQSKAVIPCTT